MKRLLFVCIILASIRTVAVAQTSLYECRQAARENYPEIRKLDIIKATSDCNLKERHTKAFLAGKVNGNVFAQSPI